MKTYTKSTTDQCIDFNLGGVTITEVKKIKCLSIIVDHKVAVDGALFLYFQ